MPLPAPVTMATFPFRLKSSRNIRHLLVYTPGLHPHLASPVEGEEFP
jgi:hypothetical protein